MMVPSIRSPRLPSSYSTSIFCGVVIFIVFISIGYAPALERIYTGKNKTNIPENKLPAK
jgi:hypothetical protein